MIDDAIFGRFVVNYTVSNLIKREYPQANDIKTRIINNFIDYQRGFQVKPVSILSSVEEAKENLFFLFRTFFSYSPYFSRYFDASI